MAEDQAYVIPLDYGDRSGTREFLRALLTRYDRDTLVGCTLHVNNHPYCLQAYLCLNFWNEHDFEGWLAAEFPRLSRDFRFLSSEIMEAVFKKGFNVIGFADPDLLEVQISDLANGVFLFPSRAVMDQEFGKPVAASTYSVFLSHSSADKPLVNGAFEALHKAGIRAWYDRYEIAPGDSITSKINDGLSRSDLGLIFLSKSFLGRKTGWTMSEANFFFQQRMRDESKRFIVVAVDLTHDEMPPLLQDYRYISAASPGFQADIVAAVVREKSRAQR